MLDADISAIAREGGSNTISAWCQLRRGRLQKNGVSLYMNGPIYSKLRDHVSHISRSPFYYAYYMIFVLLSFLNWRKPIINHLNLKNLYKNPQEMYRQNSSSMRSFSLSLSLCFLLSLQNPKSTFLFLFLSLFHSLFLLFTLSISPS